MPKNKNKKLQTTEKLNREEKAEIHKLHFDPLNQAIISSDKAMRKVTSLRYQLLAAVFLGETLEKGKNDGTKFGVQAIIDSVADLHPGVIQDLYPEKSAREEKDPPKTKPASHTGDHHFSNFPQAYKAELLACLHYINYEFHKGNAQKIADHLNKWDGKLIADIKKISPKISEEKRNEEIAKIIAKDEFIKSIRKIIGLEKDDNLTTGETKKESPTNKEKTDKSKEELAKNIFIQALAEDIYGNTAEASRLFEEAEKLGYSKKKETTEVRTELSPEDHIRNSTYVNTYLFYQKYFPEKVGDYQKRMAEAGVPIAQFQISAEYYEAGRYPEAVKYLKLAANKGFAEAQCILGALHKVGENVEKNPQEAARLYRLAANQGDVTSQAILATMHYMGDGINQNFQEAAKFYSLAAEQDHTMSQCNLGKMYAVGEGVLKNRKEAERLLKLAADKGLAEAQLNLGLIYAGTNEEESLKYFILAAAQKNEKAIKYTQILSSKLGQDYHDSDSEKAEKFYRIAHEFNDPEAQFCLAQLCLKQEKYIEAYDFMNSADKAGIAGANEHLSIYKEYADLEKAQNKVKEFDADLALFKQLVTEEEQFRKKEFKNPEAAAQRKSEIIKLYTKCLGQVRAKGENDLQLDQTEKNEIIKTLRKAAELFPSKKAEPSSNPIPQQNNKVLSNPNSRVI